MSYVGDPFRHDLFVSYSHGTAVADPTGYDDAARLRSWSRAMIREVTGTLRLGLSDDPTRRFDHYLDDRDTQSGEDLRLEVEAAARSSALILVLMSPAYRDSRQWCWRELDWFFDQARRDGRGNNHCVLRVVVPTSHSPANPWPPQLLDVDGQTVSRGDPLHTATGSPIELAEGAHGRPFDLLNRHLTKLSAEIKTRLDTLRAQMAVAPIVVPAAAASAAPAQPPPLPPPSPAATPTPGPAKSKLRRQLYLQRHPDGAAWQQVRSALAKVAIVNPPAMEPESTELSLFKTYKQRRHLALANCQGMVFVRTSPDDPIALQVASGYADRIVFEDADLPSLAWVLIDGVDDDGPADLEGYDLPRVRMSEPEWPAKALAEMR